MKFFKIVAAFVLITFNSPILLASNNEVSDQQSVVYFVTAVKRYVDLDNNTYSFKVTLNNNHIFEVPASLDDVLDEKIHKDQIFQLISEIFVRTKPWQSTFIYESLDGIIQLNGQFDSITSHWYPVESEKMVVIARKEGYWSMGRANNLIHFSDGSYTNNREMFIKAEVDDVFFQVQPPQGNVPTLLISAKNGRLILGRYDNERFIPVTW